MKKAIYIVTIVLLLVAFGFSAVQVVNYIVESKAQAETFDELSQIRQEAKENATESTEESIPEESQEETEPTGETEPQILPDYRELYEMNNDLVGWIRIEGTKVDYPVMQTPDRENFYLQRNFNKDESAHGCIYAREVCDINEPSDNVTLYGHNMLDGSMFAALHQYDNREKWEENPLIFYDTLYEYHVYKIFAVFRTTASLGEGFSYHQFVDATTEEEFDEFIATCKRLASFDTGITPVYGDKIICLSTCEYTNVNGRLVVAAVRIS